MQVQRQLRPLRSHFSPFGLQSNGGQEIVSLLAAKQGETVSLRDRGDRVTPEYAKAS
jgi:hypothetical protein